MYYLEDKQGNVVRAINWSSDKLVFIKRQDTGRLEAHENLDALDQQKIKYIIVDQLTKKDFLKSNFFTISGEASHLRLVSNANEVLPNVNLTVDNNEIFNLYCKRTSYIAAGFALLILVASHFVTSNEQLAAKQNEQLEVVQVLNRQQIEKMQVVEPLQEKAPPVTKKVKMFAKKSPVKPTKQAMNKRQSGVLGVLGSLSKSSQRGGLNLSKAETSAGIGMGGTQGSGGTQTSIYAKGLLAAPVGTGGKAQGAGGYGTKGKGGGQAGYGKISLVGSGGDFFQPIESDSWVEGGLDRNEIAAVIQRHLSEVRFCYEQGLQQKPNLSGRLSMKFMIGPRGSVTLAQVTNSSLGHVAVETCIRDRLKTWNFPRPQGGVTVKVNYPFILKRVSSI